MRRILRITNYQALGSADPEDHTSRLGQATHVSLYFTEYIIHDDGTWEEEHSWTGVVSVERLQNLLDDDDLLRETTAPKQSGGE